MLQQKSINNIMFYNIILLIKMSLTIDNLFNFEDLFPTYPTRDKESELNYYDDDYYQVNMLKKEFNVLKLEESEPRPQRGQPLKHQEFVSKFLSPLTLNDRLIAFHGLGTGKTCLAVQVAELARKLNNTQKKTLVLVRGPTSKRNFMRELSNVCTDGDYIPANIELKEKGSNVKRYVKLRPEQRNIRIGKLIRKNYEIDTFIKFANDISKMSDEQINNLYSDRYIVVDEAHNLRFQPKDVKVSLYDQVNRLMHVAQRTKILLLTGTPMRDRPTEIVSLINLLVPKEKQIKIKDFEKILNDEAKLRSSFYGIVSYVRQMESNVRKIMEGNVSPYMKKIFTKRHKMGEIQNVSYNDAWKSESSKDIDSIDDSDDDDEEKSGKAGEGLYEKSRQCALMVLPDNTLSGEAIKNKKWLTQDKKGFFHFTKEMKDYIDKNGDSVDQRLKMLSKLSTKYAFIVGELLKNQDEKAFVYCSFVRGSGILLFAAILEHFGFEQINTDVLKDESIQDEDDVTLDEKSVSDKGYFDVEVFKKNKNRFAVITGDSVSSSIADKIINSVYNSPKNTYGDYLRIILGSHVVGEGASLYAVRQLHITSPHWNNSVTEQAIGRGLRTFAHDALREEERYIKIYRHASVFQEKDKDSSDKSIDMRMYKLSEDKDIAIKKVERAMKESAVDCYLNRKRNIRADLDTDNSAACDYQDCEYACAFVDENKIDTSDLIEDSYNLFFADRELKVIVDRLKVMFSRKESMDLLSILHKLRDYSPVLIIRALKYLIDNLVEITSSKGFVCYLREDKNLFYITKRIDYPISYLNSGYANIPEITPSMGIKDFIEESSEGFVEKQISLLDSLDFDDEKQSKEIVRIIRTILGPEERERFLEQFFIAKVLRVKKKQSLREEYLDFYGKYIYQIGDKYISFYMKPKLFYIEKSVLQDAKEYYKKNKRLSEELTESLVWKEADEEITKIFNDYEKEEKDRLNSNEFGYYAILSEDKEEGESLGEFVFKIMKIRDARTTATGKTDKRIMKEVNPGTKCGTGKYKIPNLIEIMFNATAILLKEGASQEKFPKITHFNKKKNVKIDDIFKMKSFNSQPDEVKDEIKKHKDKEWLVEILLGITEISLKSCNDIKKWFIENDLYIIL